MKKEKIFEGKILGLSVYQGKIEGRKVKREMIEHRGAAAILAFDENKKVILVKQHRYPHGYVLEIPAGTLEKRVIHCYVASGLKKIAELNLDDDEILSVVKVDLKKLLRMIKTGKIQDSKTICAVLTFAAKKKLY